jgi:hypothetical protein
MKPLTFEKDLKRFKNRESGFRVWLRKWKARKTIKKVTQEILDVMK